MSTYLHGKDLQVYDTSGSSDAALIACAKSCEIEEQAEMIETCSGTQGAWREFRTGRKEFSIHVSALMTSNGAVNNLKKIGNTYTIKVGTSSSQMTGTVKCERINEVGTVGNLATCTAIFRGSGALNEVSPSLAPAT